MARKESRKTLNKCPKCGTIVDSPTKTWQLIAPIPDSAGRVTITIMGVFECPNCGYKWRGVVSKMKVGGGDVEIEGVKKTITLEERPERSEKVIELDLSELSIEEEE
ncbi:chromatin protein Cren7 [Ignisphaera sp. 4213-co]|uniref:Chromatin protein Cren7 n=1 Tax=Ignisphaera cupida TaxID=3050454 RepID=A0ABD4Z532_9CREN|nr:chromatin protein Cren7 [Ignisphaera sp. 4213-co]MDK6028416.1 chromatin protein Cren7 [Ignisphaera sp. 4213-co]